MSDLKCFNASEILICKSDNWVAIQSTLWGWSPLYNSHNVLSRPPAVYGLCYLMATASISLAIIINCGNLCTMVSLPWYNFFSHTCSLPTRLIRWLQWRNCHDQNWVAVLAQLPLKSWKFESFISFNWGHIIYAPYTMTIGVTPTVAFV